MNFYIDGVELGDWSGDKDWTYVSFGVSEGIHTFTWEYAKDGSVSDGEDSARIDNVELP